MRFVETILLSTHETLHIKKYTLYSESNVPYILFDVCGCFDVLGFGLSRFKSIAATSKSKNSVFASSAKMSKLLLFGYKETFVKQADSSLLSPLFRDVFPRRSTYPFLLHFGKVRIYVLSRKSSHICPFSEKNRIKTHRFL